jgi:uracil-DNA glycosylase
MGDSGAASSRDEFEKGGAATAMGLSANWQDHLADRYDLVRLCREIGDLYGDGAEPVFPKRAQVFRAFQLTSLEDVRVVILGQDPYTRPEEADGLAFSMPKRDAQLPRSLRAIYSNIANDPEIGTLGQTVDGPRQGDLTAWAERGVLLLNSGLTVGSRAGSHRRQWRGFARAVLDVISEKRDPVAFLLWGAPAIRAAQGIRSTEGKHLFSASAHPAAWTSGRLKPFAAVRHFSAANQHLGDRAIDWSLATE